MSQKCVIITPPYIQYSPRYKQLNTSVAVGPVYFKSNIDCRRGFSLLCFARNKPFRFINLPWELIFNSKSFSLLRFARNKPFRFMNLPWELIVNSKMCKLSVISHGNILNCNTTRSVMYPIMFYKRWQQFFLVSWLTFRLISCRNVPSIKRVFFIRTVIKDSFFYKHCYKKIRFFL